MTVTLPLFLLFLPILLIWVGRALKSLLSERRRRNELAARIYGPPAHPLLGHLPIFPKCQYEWVEFLISQSNEALAKGHKLIHWWAAWKLAIWTLDAETSKVILEHSTELKKGRDYDFYRQWLGQGLLLSDGQRWREQRKTLTPTFHFTMLEQYMTVFNRQAKVLVERLSLLEGQSQQNIAPLLTRCSLDIIGEAAMGVHLDAQRDGSPDYVRAVARFNFIAHKFSTNLVYNVVKPIWLLTELARETRRHLKTLKNFSGEVIRERIEAKTWQQSEATHKRGKAFMDLLLELEADGKMAKEEVREQIDTFLFAGHDTTANALAWTIWCLACHPECQRKARQECLDVFGTADEQEEQLGVPKANALRYLDCCVRETLRLFPPVPVLERDLQEDLWIGDTLVPKGTMCVVSPFILHHREQVYPRHREFDPENFSPERQATRHAFDFVPFSAGPRNCIGQKFALLELKVLLAHVLRRFCFSTEVPFHDNRPGLEAILRPELGVPVQIRSVNSEEKM